MGKRCRGIEKRGRSRESGKGFWEKSSRAKKVVKEENRGSTVYDLVRDLSAPLFLIMLDQAMRINGVGHRAVEVEGDAGGAAVGGHEGGVFLHALLGSAVFGVLVPFVFVVAFFAGVGVELVGEEFDGEGDISGGGEGAELAKGWGVGMLGTEWDVRICDGEGREDGESKYTLTEEGKDYDLAGRRDGGHTFIESITIDKVN